MTIVLKDGNRLSPALDTIIVVTSTGLRVGLAFNKARDIPFCEVSHIEP